jgi:hypothetical protein
MADAAADAIVVGVAAANVSGGPHQMYASIIGHRQPVATKAMDAHAYTALPIAAARAIASQGNNPIIRDPLAAKLVAGVTHLLCAAPNYEYMIMRCLLGDELIQERHTMAGVRQVVGAHYYTRPLFGFTRALLEGRVW